MIISFYIDRFNSLFLQTNNSYFICEDPLVIDQIFARIRNYDGQVRFHFRVWTPSHGMLIPSFQGSSEKQSYPKSIARLDVSSVVDLTKGYDSSNPPTYKPSLPLSSGHMIQFRATSKDDFKIVLTIRTSGTEPKVCTKALCQERRLIWTTRQIKYYLEGSGKNRDTVQEILKEVAQELGDAWMQTELNKLGRP